jgi:NhaP-type Na+/H+ or K+/H+ antiporter
VTASNIFVGIGLTFALAIGCQVLANRFRIPAIILLLPVGFVAGILTSSINPNRIFGAAFSPMVSLAVAIILFDGGLDLVFNELEGHSRRVVRRLLYAGIPITWAGAAAFAALLLGLPSKAALMLGAILIVSGPTVVAPLLSAARPGQKLVSVLGWESTSVDPLGAVIGVLVFQGIQSGKGRHILQDLLELLARVGIGVAGGAVGVFVLWIVLGKLRLSRLMATETIVATVLTVAALCDAIRDDTGLVAALTMGIALANLPGLRTPEDRPFFQTIVQLTIGLLFISISATVTPASLKGVLWPSIGLIVCLVLVVRPLVALLATARTSLTRQERTFVGAMDPRGIIAASTAATFSAPLVASGVAGANKLLPATFLVIVGTVAVYGLTAVPLARVLGLRREPETDESSEAVPG